MLVMSKKLAIYPVTIKDEHISSLNEQIKIYLVIDIRNIRLNILWWKQLGQEWWIWHALSVLFTFFEFIGCEINLSKLFFM